MTFPTSPDLMYAKLIEFENANVNLNMVISSMEIQMSELKKNREDCKVFMGLVTHELRSPLSNLSGFAELALEDSEEDRIEKLRMMQKVIRGLHEFTEELGDFFRSVNMTKTSEYMNMESLIHQSVKHFSYLMEGAKVKVNIKEKGKHAFRSDALKMKIIINNLIGNSIKYRMAGKPLRIKARITYEQQGITLEIADNGRGIEPSKLGKIFDMFYRADNTGQGIGLGLYLVKNMVTALGGSITVSSELTKGTTFTIVIPNDATSIRKSIRNN